ncbi:hypothetical protein MAPG_06322 [Magnaporthiopsis poae ATCC 64411]|uniref:Uncharacterized protein n=1 Tax=Magnaporthiopsis poae (strain ATCC 64411 / 73-15) TaxID=644358 RepID=A0A0C4E1Q5_MAGP6|nr:hypothetical protein MAPG_06322 [Magnaporthiopsis poae ATCC 64411]
MKKRGPSTHTHIPKRMQTEGEGIFGCTLTYRRRSTCRGTWPSNEWTSLLLAHDGGDHARSREIQDRAHAEHLMDTLYHPISRRKIRSRKGHETGPRTTLSRGQEGRRLPSQDWVTRSEAGLAIGT